MRRRIIDVTDLQPIRKGRPRGVKTLSASPAEMAIARQMAERERVEALETLTSNGHSPWAVDAADARVIRHRAYTDAGSDAYAKWVDGLSGTRGRESDDEWGPYQSRVNADDEGCEPDDEPPGGETVVTTARRTAANLRTLSSGQNRPP